MPVSRSTTNNTPLVQLVGGLTASGIYGTFIIGESFARQPTMSERFLAVINKRRCGMTERARACTYTHTTFLRRWPVNELNEDEDENRYTYIYLHMGGVVQ